MPKLWRSGVILSAAGLLAGLGNYAFQAIIGRCLDKAEYGYVNSTLSFIGLLGLPLGIASTSVTHYIAHFRATGDEARLEGLLSGCRKFLFRLTLAGSVAAAVLVNPLSSFFHFPRQGLMLVALACALAGLWGAFVNTLCQGLSWFGRLACITLVMMVLRLSVGAVMVLRFPVAEAGVLASGVASLAYLMALRWRKELASKTNLVSPWNMEFAQYLAVGAAWAIGGYCLIQGDLLVAQRNFAGRDLGLYTAAGLLGRALPMVVAPMLTVLFTSRSAHRTDSALGEQLKLLGLYVVGLATGAAGLLLLRNFWVRLIFGNYTPEAAAMVSRLAVTMAFIGLMQALGMWALASRWLKMALLYGASGLVYWLVLLAWGKSPTVMLQLMPAAAGSAFGLLFVSWLATMRTSHSGQGSGAGGLVR
jgi:O-antigen/teichoic acid export membrane protein